MSEITRQPASKRTALVPMEDGERQWVQLKWKSIREAQARADEAGNRWRRLNSELNEYLDRQGINDIVQRDKIKSTSLSLRDAMDTGKWHSGEAMRHIADVQLFLQMKSLGVL